MRAYLIFGSDDGRYWEQLGEVTVGSASQALNEARKSESYKHYSTTTKRGWFAMTPEEEVREPVIKWKRMVPGQMTVDDAIEPTRVTEPVRPSSDET